MSRTATQLTITIPEGAAAGSVLSIPVRGRAENIKARVPEGYGPGSTLVLTQLEGTDEWVDESLLQQAEQAAAGAASSAAGCYSDRTPTPPPEAVGPDLTQGLDLEPLVPEGPVAYTVRLDTTAGIIDIIVRPDWAPHGARRFLQLAQSGDLDGLSFYRSVKGCLAQFGLPAKRQWPPLPDDAPTGVPFLLGAVCFAAVGKASRKSTLFICIGDMSHCFGQSPWETPIGAVAEASLDALDRIETCYGDIAECGGTGPDTGRINAEGSAYLQATFPKLTYIRKATPLDWPPPAAAPEVPHPASEQSAAAQMLQAAEAMKAVFQGPPGAAATAPAAVQEAQFSVDHKAGGTVIDVPIEVMAGSASKVRTSSAQVLPVTGVSSRATSSASAPRVVHMGAPQPLSVGSYVLPGAGAATFEQQAQHQARALMQAQQAAALKPGQEATPQPVTTSSSVQVMYAGNAHPRNGSYVPPGAPGALHLPPQQSGSYVPPPMNGSFVPPVHTSGSFVPPGPHPQAVGSASLPAGPPMAGPLGCGMGLQVPGPFGHGPAAGPCGTVGCGGPCGLGAPCGLGPCGCSGLFGSGGCSGPCATGPCLPGSCGGPCATGPCLHGGCSGPFGLAGCGGACSSAQGCGACTAPGGCEGLPGSPGPCMGMHRLGGPRGGGGSFTAPPGPGGLGFGAPMGLAGGMPGCGGLEVPHLQMPQLMATNLPPPAMPGFHPPPTPAQSPGGGPSQPSP
eukprot:TRINITY_DN7302_c0_g1_i3.p1 TRINITY_DN7302_c0_g1~~TRINITY_DN7302_c0_g1_i3.p1  ORF type:complete len:733 (-),score=109.81 TRINITY_DN7302_c0_g1_i3:60-2258(-)